jgi:hypothetical protein
MYAEGGGGGGGGLFGTSEWQPRIRKVGSDSIGAKTLRRTRAYKRTKRKQKQMGADYLSHESSFCSFPMLVERVRALNSAATTWLIASSSLSFS